MQHTHCSAVLSLHLLQGRPYHDKMVSDRTEMLYWLQQQRRLAVLQPAVKTLNLGCEVELPAPPPGSTSGLHSFTVRP